MKILVTRFGTDLNSVHDKYFTGFDTFSKILVHDLGHEVYVMPPAYALPYLDTYDRVIIQMEEMTGVAAVHSLAALELMWNARGLRIPTVTYFSDAYFNFTHLSLKRFVENEWKFFAQQAQATFSGGDLDSARAMARTILTEGYPNPAAHLFPWGDAKVFKTKMGQPLAFRWDPTPCVPSRGGGRRQDPERRQKQWVDSNLKGHTKPWWVATWPVIEVRDLSEQRLQEIYDSNWGVLTYQYRHTKIGWWRHRWVQAAYSGAYLMVHPDEADTLDACYQHAFNEVEDWSWETLYTQAERQADWFFSNTWSFREHCVNAIRTFIEELT